MSKSLLLAIVAWSATAQTVQPRVVSHPEPKYTELARKLYVSGTVAVRLTIGADGTVHDVRVIKPLGFGLDRKAVEAASAWRFEPGTKDGAPVEVPATIQINFRLQPPPGRPIPGRDYWRGAQMIFPASGPVVTGASPAIKGEANANGSAGFEFTVDPEGHASQIRVLHASDPRAADEIAKQLATWKFGYADKPDIPAGAVGRVRFVLNQGDDDVKNPLVTPAK